MSCNFASKLAKLHDMYLYKTYLFHINHYLKSILKVALLHRFNLYKTPAFYNIQFYAISMGDWWKAELPIINP